MIPIRIYLLTTGRAYRLSYPTVADIKPFERCTYRLRFLDVHRVRSSTHRHHQVLGICPVPSLQFLTQTHSRTHLLHSEPCPCCDPTKGRSSDPAEMRPATILRRSGSLSHRSWQGRFRALFGTVTSVSGNPEASCSLVTVNALDSRDRRWIRDGDYSSTGL